MVVLWWEPVIEALLDNDFAQQNGEADDGLASAHLVGLF